MHRMMPAMRSVLLATAAATIFVTTTSTQSILGPPSEANLWLSKTSYALRRLRLWMFSDSLVSWRPSSSRCSTLFGSCSDHGFRCTWKSSRSDTS